MYADSLFDPISILPRFMNADILRGVWCLTPGSAANWPTANLAILTPYRVFAPTPVYRACWRGGNTTNLDVGIYRASTLQLVVSTGAVANVSGLANYSFTSSAILEPGDYYIAMSSGGAPSIVRASPDIRTSLQLEVTSSYPLPATIGTPTIASQAYFPLIGICTTASDL
jgi:hypothetical protein